MASPSRTGALPEGRELVLLRAPCPSASRRWSRRQRRRHRGQPGCQGQAPSGPATRKPCSSAR
eukprot:12290314-Alexandrium_andersonii.AAC.1